ncbi:NAPG family protein [Megaselia abdita]
MSLSQKKVEEGNECCRQAEKYLKTGLLKWKPEYELAAGEYEKAGTAFRIAKSFEQSHDSFLKAADCHKNARSWFHAAKCYEQIIMVLKDTNNLPKIEEYANRACHLYQQHGSPQSGSAALDKAAKIVEGEHPDIALRFYQHALEVVLIDDSINQGGEYATKISRLTVKLGLFDQATDAIRREIGINQQTESYQQIGRLAVALVLVQLARGDTVAAEKAFKEWGNCCDPQEVQTLEMLLQAFDDEDPEAAAQALNSPFIKHMDVEYARLARDLPLPRGISVAPKPKAVADNPTTSFDDSRPDEGVGGGVAADEDNEEGGLC